MAYRPRNYEQRISRRNQIHPSGADAPSNYNNQGYRHRPEDQPNRVTRPKQNSDRNTRSNYPQKSSQDDISSRFNVYTGGDKSSGLDKYTVYRGDSTVDKALSKYNVYGGDDKQRNKDSSSLSKYSIYSGDTKQTNVHSQDQNKNQSGADILDRYKVYTGADAGVSDLHNRNRHYTYSDKEVVQNSGDDVDNRGSARNVGGFEGYYSDGRNQYPPDAALWGMTEDVNDNGGGWDPMATTDGSGGHLDEVQHELYHPDDAHDGPTMYQYGAPQYDDTYYDKYEEDLMNMPSQMFMAGTATVRYRTVGHQRQRVMCEEEDVADTQAEEEALKFNEIVNELNNLRSQPWSIQHKRNERQRLKRLLALSHRPMMSMGPVLNKVKSGKSTVTSFLDIFDPMRPILQQIESRFGASVVAVFNLIRDLCRLNFLLLLLLSCVVIAPTMILIGEDEGDQMWGWDSFYTNKTWTYEESNTPIDICDYITQEQNYTNECSNTYIEVTNNETINDVLSYFRDFLGGTGYLERTFLFSGYYPVKIDKAKDYKVSLAYLITMALIYFVSFVYVAYFLAKWVRSTAINTKRQNIVYSTIIFSSWDFSTKQEKASKLESKLIRSELKAAIDTEKFFEAKKERKTVEKLGLYSMRILLNLLILAVIIGGWIAIYAATEFSTRQDPKDEIQSFFLEYFPTIIVSVLNFMYPVFFNILVQYEKYSGRFELLITLVRSVLVRLTSLGVLFYSQLAQIMKNISEITDDTIDNCIYNGEYLCWETHLGQQVYSLLIFEFLIQLGITFGVNILRWMIRSIFKNKTLQAIGNIQFYVPGHVLDVVYIQTLCWLGAIYSPLMPALAMVMLLVHFGFKMFTAFVTCLPPDRIFQASRSSAMFMTVISISYALCLVPTGFAVLWITPSRSCGPFRGLNIAWEVFTYSICTIKGKATEWIRDVIFFLDNGLFIALMFILIIFLVVYFLSINAAKGAYIEVLQTRMKTVIQEKKRLIDKYKNLKRRQQVQG